ncbi:S9 family peptidase [Porticoccaceae bacterium]|nr:S9 family peptidase [Porticoccaceae bacterium]
MPVNQSDQDMQIMVGKYERAQTIIQGLLTKNMVMNTTVIPTWIGDTDYFWYIRDTKIGKEYRLVNAKTASNDTAFDHTVLASLLSEGVEEEVSVEDLPIHVMEITQNPLQVKFKAFEKDWLLNVEANTCKEIELNPSNWEISPDGKYAVFDRDFNLWIRELESGDERPLTHDGEDDFAYGAYGSAWGVPPGGGEVKLQVLWSPDSKRLLTAQRDRRKVKELPIVHHVPQDGSVRPVVEFTKIAYPGDDHIETLRVLSIDVDSGLTQEANYRPIPATRSDWGLITANLGWWAADSQRAYFVDMERDYKTVRVVEFNTNDGQVKTLFKETSETQLNLMLNSDERPTFMPLPESNELLWFSERSGWAHLYLYDLDTGNVKNLVTQGEWVVRDVVNFNTLNREVFIQTGGRFSDRDPYYRDLVRVNIDSGEVSTIASSDHEIWAISQKNFSADLMKEWGVEINDNACGVSNSGNFAVINRSRADEAPTTLLFDRDGNEIFEVEATDISGLPESWKWPEPVKLLAADGKTDIYGLVYRPSDFSAEKLYPVIDYVFTTPEYPYAAKGSFTNSILLGWPYLDAAAVAELGFIVVQIDGRGLPFRSKAFQDESYGWIGDVSSFDDHIAGIRQLAERYPYMDLERVGIDGCAAGMNGVGAVEGLLGHPEFYKVGVVGSFSDSRFIAGPMWGEKWEGLLGQTANGQHVDELAERLEGHLLMIHGMIDKCAAPSATFRLVDALYKANKDVDLVLLPNLAHDVDTYAIRRTWDYFVKHLLGVTPPKNFNLSTPFDTVSMNN